MLQLYPLLLNQSAASCDYYPLFPNFLKQFLRCLGFQNVDRISFRRESPLLFHSEALVEALGSWKGFQSNSTSPAQFDGSHDRNSQKRNANMFQTRTG